MKIRSTYLIFALVAAVWISPAGAAGWNPQGESEQLEAVQDTIAVFKSTDPGLQAFFQKAYGYAVFPTIGSGGFWIGGAYGQGVVYEKSSAIGRTTVTSISVGFVFGGQTYSELIFFSDKATLDNFKAGNTEFSAQASAVIATTGAAAKTSYNNSGVAVFVHVKGGAMVDASVGGQKFSYVAGLTD